MAQHKRKVPGYCRHKASGQAVVRLGGWDVYLGPYGSPESRERYTAAISEWHAIEVQISQPTVESERDPRRVLLTISEVLAVYQIYAKQYYSWEGRQTKEYVCQRDALRPLRALYGSTIASEFGPLKLKAVRQHLIDQGLCRKLINSRINRIRRFFKWGPRSTGCSLIGLVVRSSAQPRECLDERAHRTRRNHLRPL